MPYKDPEKKKEYDRKYRLENLESLREWDRQYYLEHREAKLEYKRLYRMTHKEHAKEYKRKYRITHKEQEAEYKRQRRTRFRKEGKCPTCGMDLGDNLFGLTYCVSCTQKRNETQNYKRWQSGR